MLKDPVVRQSVKDYKQAEKEIEDLQAASVAKQKELHEKYNTH